MELGFLIIHFNNKFVYHIVLFHDINLLVIKSLTLIPHFSVIGSIEVQCYNSEAIN